MHKFTTCLWFNDNAEEAVNFYTTIFPDSKIGALTRYGKAGAKVSGRTEGAVMTIVFEINGQEFMALNGGMIFTFTPATSFIVNCKTQQELDNYWDKLSQGGQPSQCGWLTDKFGLSWQIVPTVLGEMMQDKDTSKSERVMKAILQMSKLDIAALEKAYKG